MKHHGIKIQYKPDVSIAISASSTKSILPLTLGLSVCDSFLECPRHENEFKSQRQNFGVKQMPGKKTQDVPENVVGVPAASRMSLSSLRRSPKHSSEHLHRTPSSRGTTLAYYRGGGHIGEAARIKWGCEPNNEPSPFVARE